MKLNIRHAVLSAVRAVVVGCLGLSVVFTIGFAQPAEDPVNQEEFLSFFEEDALGYLKTQSVDDGSVPDSDVEGLTGTYADAEELCNYATLDLNTFDPEDETEVSACSDRVSVGYIIKKEIIAVNDEDVSGQAGVFAEDGDFITFEITSETLAGTPVINLQDTYASAYYTFIESTFTDNMDDPTDGDITWTDFAPGSPASFQVTLQLNYTGTGVVCPGNALRGVDANGDIQAYVDVCPTVGADFTLTKEMIEHNDANEDGLVNAGETVTFAITVGEGIADTVVGLTDTYDAVFFEYVSADVAPTSQADGEIIWEGITVPTTIEVVFTALYDEEEELCSINVVQGVQDATGYILSAEAEVCAENPSPFAFEKVYTGYEDVDEDGTLNIGDTVTFELQVSDMEPGTTYTVTDDLEVAFLSYIIATPAPDDAAANPLMWALNGDDESVTITLEATVVELNAMGKVCNTATVTWFDEAGDQQTETVEECDTDTDPITGYDISKVANVPTDQTLAVGDQITYTVAIENTGTVAIDEVSVQDYLDENVNLITDVSEVAHLTYDERPVHLLSYELTESDANPIPANNNVTNDHIRTFSFTVEIIALPQVEEGEAPQVCNEIFSHSGYCVDPDVPHDGNLTSEEQCHTVVPKRHDYLVRKISDPEDGTDVEVGSTIVYTIEVENTGMDPLYDISVIEALDAGLTFVGEVIPPDVDTTNHTVTQSVDDAQEVQIVVTELAAGEVETIMIEATITAEGEICNGPDNITTTANPTDPTNVPACGYDDVNACFATHQADYLGCVTDGNEADFCLQYVANCGTCQGCAQNTCDTTLALTQNAALSGMHYCLYTAERDIATCTAVMDLELADAADAYDQCLIDNDITTVTTEESTETGDEIDLIEGVFDSAATCVVATEPVPPVVITKDADRQYPGVSVQLGEVIEFSITVENNAGEPLTNVVITDELVAGFVFEGATDVTDTATYEVDPDTNVLTIDLGDTEIPAEGSITKVFALSVGANATAGMPLPNCASVDGQIDEEVIETVETEAADCTTHKVTITIINDTDDDTDTTTNTDTTTSTDVNSDTDTTTPTYTTGNGGGGAPTFVRPPAVPAPEAPFCSLDLCDDCLIADETYIRKMVQNPASAELLDGETAFVPYGDKVYYEVEIFTRVQNKDAERILTNAKVHLYDRVVYAESGYDVWETELDQDNSVGWRMDRAMDGGSKFSYELTPPQLQQVENGMMMRFGYWMDTNLTPEADLAEGVTNVAFAVMELEYDGGTPQLVTLNYEQFVPTLYGADCRNITELMYEWETQENKPVSLATYGDKATMNIIRPYAETGDGSTIFIRDEGATNKLFGTTFSENPNALYAAGELYDAQTGSVTFTTVFDDDAYMNELLRSTETVIVMGVPMEKVRGREIYFYLESEPLMLAGDYAFSDAATFVVDVADVEIDEDVTFSDAAPGFILRSGNLYIDTDVENMQGLWVFADEGGYVYSGLVTDIDPVSYAPYTLEGLLFGANIEHFASHRLYIGTDAAAQLEPSMLFITDQRLIDAAPPLTQDVLQGGWAQTE